MFDFGFSEILLTSAIALVVLGPERLPKVARQVGNWMGRARVMARQLTEQLEREVNAEELLKLNEKAAPAKPRPPVSPNDVAETLYPTPLAPDQSQPPDTAGSTADAAPTTGAPAADPAAPGGAAPTPLKPPRPPHPNSPAMMHARDAVAPSPSPSPSSTENSIKPANE
jgi:sec-independent protein translocase protein TatB